MMKVDTYIATDIHHDNILLELRNDAMCGVLKKKELDNPSPVKVYSNHQIHTSLQACGQVPGPPVLGDFSNALPGPGLSTTKFSHNDCERLRWPFDASGLTALISGI